MVKHVTAIKLTVVAMCLLLTSTIFVVIMYSINGVYSWFSGGKEFLMVHKYKIELFALLFLIVYGSTRCTPCSQHNGMIYHKFLKKVNIVHTKYVNTVIAEVKI